MDLKMDVAKEFGCGNSRALQLGLARRAEVQTSRLAKDIKTLTQWLRRDVLALAGPCLATRVELFDFVTAELVAREHLDSKRIRPVRLALQNQRDDLLAFAGIFWRIGRQIECHRPRPRSPHVSGAPGLFVAAQARYITGVLARVVPTVRPDGAQVSCRL